MSRTCASSSARRFSNRCTQTSRAFSSTKLPTAFGDFVAYGYRALIDGKHHVALVKGDIDGASDVLVRVHSECLTGDVFHSLRCDCGEQLESALRMIEQEGAGVLLYLSQEGRGIGLLNKLLVDLRIIAQPMVWFASADLAFWAIVISITWKVVGFGMVLFIAAIQSIDREILEAAIIDGAGYWKRAFLIVVPLSRRIILLATLVSAIGSMLAFDQFYIMTSGGPRGQTFTAVYWIYQNSFVSFRLGYGAALSIVLTLIIFVFATLQVGLTARSEAQ